MMEGYMDWGRRADGYLEKKSRERIESLFREMEAHGIKGDLACWNVLLTSKMKSENPEVLEEMFERMRSHGWLSEEGPITSVSPDSSTGDKPNSSPSRQIIPDA